MSLRVMFKSKTWHLTGSLVIGRLETSDIHLNDPGISSSHAKFTDCTIEDLKSTNGTYLNGKPLIPGHKYKLIAGDSIRCGTATLTVEPEPSGPSNERKKPGVSRFHAGPEDKVVSRVQEPALPTEVHDLIISEFGAIIGHETIKSQLLQFHKKVQLDVIRDNLAKLAGPSKLKKSQPLYHMIFSGPPGTGKTTMANSVSKILLRMGLIKSDKVIFVNNALELLAGYAGQTPKKVDDKVAEAEGGVIFIDEAYSIVKSKEHQQDSFGKEAIETIMKHLDPPSAVFIFAGYSGPMGDFLEVNPGLARRIPYRYHFAEYSILELTQIFAIMCKSRGEILEPGIVEKIPGMLCRIPMSITSEQNAGLINNWINFAQLERDDRLDLVVVSKHPETASVLSEIDLEIGLRKLTATHEF